MLGVKKIKENSGQIKKNLIQKGLIFFLSGIMTISMTSCNRQTEQEFQEDITSLEEQIVGDNVNGYSANDLSIIKFTDLQNNTTSYHFVKTYQNFNGECDENVLVKSLINGNYLSGSNITGSSFTFTQSSITNNYFTVLMTSLSANDEKQMIDVCQTTTTYFVGEKCYIELWEDLEIGEDEYKEHYLTESYDGQFTYFDENANANVLFSTSLVPVTDFFAIDDPDYKISVDSWKKIENMVNSGTITEDKPLSLVLKKSG